MRILKSNTKEVFDTSDINFKETFTGKTPENSMALHQNHDMTDLEFLQQFFPNEHSIFSGFSNSYFYILK